MTQPLYYNPRSLLRPRMRLGGIILGFAAFGMAYFGFLAYCEVVHGHRPYPFAPVRDHAGELFSLFMLLAGLLGPLTGGFGLFLHLRLARPPVRVALAVGCTVAALMGNYALLMSDLGGVLTWIKD